MRKTLAILIVAVTVAMAVPAFAELQNVQVGGQIRIRGNWYWSGHDAATEDLGLASNNAFVEQRTRLNVKADFTDSVTACIELDSYDRWGEDFRSNYLTGVDARGVTTDDVEVYQAYIEANEMWGTGLRARIGRQELKLGSGWLVGNGSSGPYFTGLSFDAVRLSYITEQFTVDALWAKLAESSPLQEDGDADLYGVYGSYLGIENVTLDAYWLFVRDATNQMLKTPDMCWPVAIPGSLDLHTFGLRGAGTLGAFDFDAEVAYQMGFITEVDFDWTAWGGNVEAGYTIDMTYTPRVFIGGAYLEGSEDGMSFNRLFSDKRYSKFLDGNWLVAQTGGIFNPQYAMTGSTANSEISNLWTVHAGVSAMPTESLKVELSGAYLGLLNDCGWTDSSDLGWEVGATAVYSYSEDLSIEVGYAHLFTGDALDEGATVALNGTQTVTADNQNLLYFETKLSF